MDKSLESRRIFKGSNKRMLKAVWELSESGKDDLLEKVDFIMDVSVYEYMLDNGFYKSFKRKKSDRRNVDRRGGDRRESGKH